MSRPFLPLALVLVLASSFAASRAKAQAMCVDMTGMACLNLLSASSATGVVDDVFQTHDGLFAPQLTFATYIRGVNGCIGNTYDPTMLTAYMCHAVGAEDPAPYANSLDWQWTQVVRTHDDGTSVADGEGGFYIPWRGRIMDIGAEANRVVLFPITDHPPLPCEAFEYSVYLSNDPDATMLAPMGAPDATKWNPAKLIRAFTQGWTRNSTATGVADATGRTTPELDTFLHDTSHGDAIADALATVWALPCGITFRYVSIVGGNYGNPGPECQYDSSEDELDAVAGLNEDDTSLCPDMDGDHHRALSCGGDDCDDTDPLVHPGAFEPCDATRDLDCMPPVVCPTGTTCSHATGLCSPACFEGSCGAGFACATDGTCIETACAGVACTAGMLCRAGTCVDACAGATCPHGTTCISGACIDLCLGVRCPTNQVCIANQPGATQLCGPSCACTEITVPLCPTGRACDARPTSPSFGTCVDPGCDLLTCAAGEVCTSGVCVDGCAGVVCPAGELCMAGACMSDRCTSITCPAGQICRAGTCLDSCGGAICAAGTICVSDACVPDPCIGITCTTGHCMAGTCVPDDVDAGPPGPDSGMTGADSGVRGDGGHHLVETGGCCGVAGGARGGEAGGALALLLAVLAVVRRRRSAF